MDSQIDLSAYSAEEVVEFPFDTMVLDSSNPVLRRYDKDKVKVIVLPKNCRHIDSQTFIGYKNLEKVVFNNKLTGIGVETFKNCSSLKEAHLPKKIKYLGRRSFYNCPNLETITIEENSKFADMGGNCIVDKESGALILACRNTVVPNGVKTLASYSFSDIQGIEVLDLPEGLESIQVCAIRVCPDLKVVNIPKSVSTIKASAFLELPNVQVINIDKDNPYYESRENGVIIEKATKTLIYAGASKVIPNDVENIAPEAFLGRLDLEAITIPKNVREFGNPSPFVACTNLSFIEVDKENPYFTSVYAGNEINAIIERANGKILLGCKNSIIPKGIKEIGDYAFYKMGKNEVELPSSLEIIGKHSFNSCGLDNIEFPQGLRVIDDGAFADNQLKSIKIPASVENIGYSAFLDNPLESLSVEPNNQHYTDMGGKNVLVDRQDMKLMKIVFGKPIPDGVCSIDVRVFANYPYEYIEIPSSVKSIDGMAFIDSLLVKVKLNDGLEKIAQEAFINNTQLTEIHIPQSVRTIEPRSFQNCPNLKNKSFYSTTKIAQSYNFDLINGATVHYKNRDLVLQDVIAYEMTAHGMAFICAGGKHIFADKNDNVVEIEYNDLMCKQTPYNQLNMVLLQNVYKLIEWNKYPDVPSHFVVSRMPVDEIPNFYLNNNKKNWRAIMGACKNADDVQKETIFDLAHALGVFSKDGKESIDATNFILHEIIEEYSFEDIHSIFSGFDTDKTPYNPVFAQFFMKYFNGKDFMSYTNAESGEEISLLSACHNNFKLVQRVYPEKKVNTRQDNERLTPELALSALKHKQYENVDAQTQKLAEKVGEYGYTQAQFDLLSQWYKEGIKSGCMFKPHTKQVGEVSFEVLSKEDPLGAVLGTATNCCQVVGNAGEECVKYGMTMPNSTFIVFRKNNRMIGQAWVWYDEKNAQITLDNIEVPQKVLHDIEKDITLKNDIVACIKVMANDLAVSMQNNGHKVKTVTVGKGYNDFNNILMGNFAESSAPQLLSDYGGYTDASNQFVLLDSSPNLVLSRVNDTLKE